MQNQVVSVSFNGCNVSFSNDAYLNATEIAKQFGKMPKDFLKSDQTKEYIKGLASYLSTKRNILVKENQLVIVKNGGNNRSTWLHPKLAIFFARWLSVDFALWCDEQIENMLHPALTRQTINTQQQHEIKEAVHQNVSRTGRTFQAVYHDLYNRFQIPKYQDLLAKDFDEAMKYLEAPKVIEKKSSYLLDIPFDLRLDRTYKVTVRNDQASRCAVMYASLQTDYGTAWDN